MVITVTLNPALDKTLVVHGFAIGEVNRVQSQREDIGGKGINVSKVLKEFGIPSRAMGLMGDNLRSRFETVLDNLGIAHDFTPTLTDTRTNIKLVDETNNTFTDINESGGIVTDKEWNHFLRRFEETLEKGDVVILAGGVRPGVPNNAYGILTRKAKAADATVLVDAEGLLLKEAILAKPHVIKPNQMELSTLLDQTFNSEAELIDGAQQLKDQGVERILVSMGAQGSIYLGKNGIYRAEGLKVPVKSTVGAGDSMVAAMVYSLLEGFDDINTLALAQGAGAASVMLEGTKACNLEQAKGLMDQALLKIREV